MGYGIPVECLGCWKVDGPAPSKLAKPDKLDELAISKPPKTCEAEPEAEADETFLFPEDFFDNSGKPGVREDICRRLLGAVGAIEAIAMGPIGP